MNTSIEIRRTELLELARRDPARVLQIWRETGGVPPGGKVEAEVDFEHVIVPAILAVEFQAGHDER